MKRFERYSALDCTHVTATIRETFHESVIQRVRHERDCNGAVFYPSLRHKYACFTASVSWHGLHRRKERSFGATIISFAALLVFFPSSFFSLFSPARNACSLIAGSNGELVINFHRRWLRNINPSSRGCSSLIYHERREREREEFLTFAFITLTRAKSSRFITYNPFGDPASRGIYEPREKLPVTRRFNDRFVKREIAS